MFSYIRGIHPLTIQTTSARTGEAVLIDVRGRDEYARGHPRGALWIPLEDLSAARVAALLGDSAGRSRPLYLLSATGVRAEQAAHRLKRGGLDNVGLVNGGVRAWRAEGLPMRRNGRAPSLERQAQIAVGVVLLLILAKALLLHPVFYLLSGVLALALIVAAGSRTYSLPALMGRLPWNRRPAGQPSAAT
jgi:rhodanese-related sulfurtransferase